ncbi:hypothetical protein OGATHE_002429 [Ogataea polymorpha]|uniref:Uncharacterized protein n=1 Tax=Ogataea polymorpha TaxID=460523 RepID=A0A9P8PCS5_9ASCO|nr:hypothetical protein OGATHE_002429 [Ogataea polymorpha]
METLDILTNSTLDASSSPRGTSISNETPRLGFDMAPAQACQPPIPHDIDWESNYELGLPDFPDLQPKQSLDSMAAALDLTDFTPPQQHSPLSLSPEIKPPAEQPQPQPQLQVSRSRSSRCPVCRKHITRDMSRHLRTHEPVSRFKCVYPREMCIHKTGQFNRPYDFKKHLLNCHFEFDDRNTKKLHNLSDKLPHTGRCHCGLKCTAEFWLDSHILPDYGSSFRCEHLNNLYEKTGMKPPSQRFSTRG